VWAVVQKLTLVVDIVMRFHRAHIYPSKVLLVVAFSDVSIVVDLTNFVSFFTVTSNFAVIEAILPLLIALNLSIWMMFETPAIFGISLSIFPRSFPNVSVLIDCSALTLPRICFKLTLVDYSHFLWPIFAFNDLGLFIFEAFSDVSIVVDLANLVSFVIEADNFAVVKAIFPLFFSPNLAIIMIFETFTVFLNKSC